jgi:hypothetical protein
MEDMASAEVQNLVEKLQGFRSGERKRCSGRLGIPRKMRRVLSLTP